MHEDRPAPYNEFARKHDTRLEEFVTEKEAADQIQISSSHLRNALEDGRIPGTLIEDFWLLTISDARKASSPETLNKKKRRPGRSPVQARERRQTI